MHRLFWKLFLSFWLALALFGAGTLLAASAYLEYFRAMQDDQQNLLGFRDRAETAREVVAREGLPGLTIWVRQVDGEELLPILALDSQGRDLLDREVSSLALAHLHRHQQLRRNLQPDAQNYHAVPMPDGNEYWLVMDSAGVTLERFISRPKVVMVPLALAVLVSGLLGLMLARYLSVPIHRLREAALAYASGNLSQRVAPSLGRRRDEIVDLALAMDNMAERLDALLESKRTLLRDVSHELRSPLARVQAALGLARKRSDANSEELDRIQHETDRLNELIGAILTYSRLDAGLQPIHHENLELATLLAEAVESTQVEADQHQIRIELECSTQGNFLGDPMLLYSTCENVLRNALQHSPDTSVIRARLSETLGPGNVAEYLIQVQDQGPGVPPEMLQTIFNPFVRAGQGHSEGLGLGLAISLRIVLDYHGRISAENHADGGLLVSIHLPRSTPSSQ